MLLLSGRIYIDVNIIRIKQHTRLQLIRTSLYATSAYSAVQTNHTAV